MQNQWFSQVWGNIPTVKLPSAIFEHGVLTLDGAALAVLIVLHQRYRGQSAHLRRMVGTRSGLPEEYNPVARVKHEELIKLTGYSDRTITNAVAALVDADFIEIRAHRVGGKKAGAEAGRYELKVPGKTLRNLKGCMLLENRETFFTMPETVVLHPVEQYSMARMEGSELRLYVAACWLATVEQKHTFDKKAHQLRNAAKLWLPTYKKALDGLWSKGLIFTSEVVVEDRDLLRIQMCNPFLGSPMYVYDTDAEDPNNYAITNARGVARRLNINKGMTPEAREDILRECLDGGPMTQQSNGDFTIRCPYPDHADSNPSCSVSTVKGCFHCYGCNKDGTFLELLKELNNGSTATALAHIAKATGQKEPEYRDPDRNALAIYSYKNKYGYELKQVVRMPNDEDGNKVFYQRRRRPDGGWTLNVQGLPPMLFNRHLLGQGEDFVVVCEGEKDARAITNFRPIETEDWSAGAQPRGFETVGERAIRLAAASDHPVPDAVRKTKMLGVTSGSSKSWSPELADLLKRSSVIVLPDDDAPGAEYGKAVTDSLDAIEIGYTLVSLAETGCKDASEFIEKHGKDAFLAFILREWENRPRSKWLPELPSSSTIIEGEIVI